MMMLWALCGLLALTKAQEICYNRGNYSQCGYHYFWGMYMMMIIRHIVVPFPLSVLKVKKAEEKQTRCSR